MANWRCCACWGVRLAQGYLLGRPAIGQLSAFPPLFNQGIGERRRKLA